jgi:hypothetical protein
MIPEAVFREFPAKTLRKLPFPAGTRREVPGIRYKNPVTVSGCRF